MVRICGGMVLYEPEINLLKENISCIIDQLDVLYIFDNGSNNSDLIKKEVVNVYPKINYYFSKKNLGIAYGLNWLLKKSMEDNFDWCLTLDQDSICSSNMISEYKKYITYPKIALISPFVLNNSKFTLEEYKKLSLPDYEYITEPMNCITSGCLTNVKIFNNLHGVNSKLFIDFVDTELNCKVLDNGYRILRANRTYLIQQMGKAHQVKLFDWLYRKTKLNTFRRMKVATVYTDQRLYFSSRNSRYIRKNFNHVGKRTSFIFMSMYYCYFSLFYPKNRSRKAMWNSIIKGFKDYKYISGDQS